MTLFPGGEFDRAVCVDVCHADGLAFVCDDHVIDATAATTDKTPGFTITVGESRFDQCLKRRHASGQFGFRDVYGRSCSALSAVFKGGFCRVSRF